ncbi:MAG: hotdog fold thioesterase [Armatimonadetes bacterium]|nr:hotdog fold thioesterase [Armatimonadota bacterium]
MRFNRFLGLKVERLGPGLADVRLPYRDEFLGDPFRPALHGGVLSFLVDVCGGLAVFSQLEWGDRCSTVDMRVDYIQPARQEDLLARARVLRLGNRVGVSSVQIYHHGSEELIADGKAVYNVRKAHTVREVR